MKKLLIIFSLTFFLQANSFAVTLSKALLEAYKNNPELNAERENINVSGQNLNISAVIMAGGFGTRLKPFTNILPKPLIPVNDKPIIKHIVDGFQQQGVKNIII